jgi:hypothetical protein
VPYRKCGSIPVNAGKYWAESAKCTHNSKIKEMGHEVHMYLTYNGNYGNTHSNGGISKKES